MSLVAIINPISGGGRQRAADRAALLTRVLSRVDRTVEVFVTERRGHARELAAAAVARGATLVFAWGGDGTVNEIGTSLAGTSTALAIVPSGSGNGLARTLGVSRDPARAILDACGAPPRVIDAGQCNGEWFFSLAGIGFDAAVAAGFDAMGQGRRGLVTYVRVAMRGLVTYRARPYTIDGVRTQAALLVTVANAAQFGNDAWIAPRARLDDGRLDLVIVEERSRLRSIWAARRLFTRSIERVPGVTTRTVTAVVVEDEAPIPYHLDGEPRRACPRLGFHVRPGVLRVAVR